MEGWWGREVGAASAVADEGRRHAVAKVSTRAAQVGNTRQVVSAQVLAEPFWRADGDARGGRAQVDEVGDRVLGERQQVQGRRQMRAAVAEVVLDVVVLGS